MKRKEKSIYYFILIIVIILGAFWYASNMMITGQKISEPIEAQPQTIPVLPPFDLGTVSKIEGSVVSISTDFGEKTVTTNEKTVVISQIKDGAGYKNVPAAIGDIKVSSKIIVYYSPKAASKSEAQKIQILNF